jgi:hypothetical protein
MMYVCYYVSPSNEGRNIVLEGHYGMRHTAWWSCTHIPNIIDLSGKTKKLWSGQASLKLSVPFLYPGVPEVLNQYWTFKNNERFFLSFYMHVCLYMCCACMCYLYNQCLQPILYLFFKMGWMNHVIKEGIQYATHRLMVMHPHTKYNWPIWKDKKVMVWTSFAEKKQKKWKKKSD